MSVCVCMCLHACVCVSTLRLLITSGVMCRDMNPIYDWLNKFYSFYVETVVGYISIYGMALALICVVQTNLRRASYRYISC